MGILLQSRRLLKLTENQYRALLERNKYHYGGHPYTSVLFSPLKSQANLDLAVKKRWPRWHVKLTGIWHVSICEVWNYASIPILQSGPARTFYILNHFCSTTADPPMEIALFVEQERTYMHHILTATSTLCFSRDNNPWGQVSSVPTYTCISAVLYHLLQTLKINLITNFRHPPFTVTSFWVRQSSRPSYFELALDPEWSSAVVPAWC
jgi:hypothetical protein